MPHCTALSVLFKTCTKCGLALPATTEHFYRQSDGRYGLRGDCKVCVREYMRRWNAANPEYHHRYYQANAETFNEKAKRWREANPEYHRRYREANAEACREYYKQRYLANAEIIGARIRRWKKEHPEKVRSYQRRYRARKRSAEGDHTADDVRIIYERQGGRCWYCQEAVAWDAKHVEHRVPLSRGGSNGPGNLVISCAGCNHRKRDKLPHEWGDRLL